MTINDEWNGSGHRQQQQELVEGGGMTWLAKY
jgi:hypothetical protein